MAENNTSSMTPATRKRAVFFILMTVLINMIGVGIAWPVLPKLVQSMGSGAISEASSTYAIIGVLFALAQFIFSPLIGMLSDKFGRRPVLLISLAGLSVDYLLTALAPTLFLLGMARIIGGIFGATLPTANAYIADISSAEDRAKNFGFIGAAFGVGFILGPAIGGYLGDIDIRLPFFTAAGLAALNVVFGYFALPESLSKENRRPVNMRQASPLVSLARIASFPMLKPLLLSLFITALAQRGLEATWMLYTEFRFGWTLQEAAYSLVFVGVLYFVVQGFLVGPSVKYLGEWRTVIVGFLLSGVSMFLFGIASQGWMVFPIIAIYVMGNGIGGPALNAICSKTVNADIQGRLQGTLNSINAVSIIIGPFLASMVLAHVASQSPIIQVPGVWFILSGFIFAIAVMFTMNSARKLAIEPEGDA